MSGEASTPIRTIGIYGAGKSGVAIARLALAAGYDVRVATSGPADRTALVASILIPGAHAVSPDELPDGSDAVVLAVPLRRFTELPLDRLCGHIVIDVMNYWPPVDGTLPDFEDGRPSSRIVQEHLPSSALLVKTLNHIGYHEMEELARPAGSRDRTGLAVAGDDSGAVSAVARLVDSLGFTPVPAGGIDSSGALQPGSPIFGADLGADTLRRALTVATAHATAR